MRMNKPAGKQLKIVKIGNSSGVILPKEVLARLAVELGDSLSLSELPDGIALRRQDEEFDAQMEVARKVMKRRRAALRELAK